MHPSSSPIHGKEGSTIEHRVKLLIRLFRDIGFGGVGVEAASSLDGCWLRVDTEGSFPCCDTVGIATLIRIDRLAE